MFDKFVCVSSCAVNPKINESQPGVQEDETDDDEGFPIFPYERLKTDSANPISEIDASKREVRVQLYCLCYFIPPYLKL